MGLYDTPVTDLRKELSHIDKELLELFRKRMNIVENLSYYKESVSAPIEDVPREREKLSLAKKQIGSPYDMYVHIFMNSLFDASKLLQQNLRNK